MRIGPAAVEESFQITGRGMVVAVANTTELPVGKPLHATLILPTGERISFQASKEWLLRRDPQPHEKEAYRLKGAEQSQIPEGCFIELESI